MKSQNCSFQKNEKSLSNRSGPNCSSPKGRKKLRYPKGSYPAEEQFTYFNFFNENLLKVKTQGGRSCAGARVAPAEKFGLGRKFYAWTYAILSQIKICRDLRSFFLEIFGHKKYLFG